MKKPAAAFIVVSLLASVALGAASTPPAAAWADDDTAAASEAVAQAADQGTGTAQTDDDATIAEATENAFDYLTQDTYDDGTMPLTMDGETPTAAKQALLDVVHAALNTYTSKVNVPSEYTYTKADVSDVMCLVIADPTYWWMASSYGYGYNTSTGQVKYVRLQYLTTNTTELASMTTKMEAKIAEALSWVDTDTMSDFEIAQALHDYLVRNSAYDNDDSPSNTSYSAYGPLVLGKGVCQGYALAYKLLLSRVGIPCIYVPCDSMNHAWNMVKIDGNWYYVDVTWDDPLYVTSANPDGADGGFDHEVSHNYFLRCKSSWTSLGYSGWSAPYETPSSDYANRTYDTYNAPRSSDGKYNISGATVSSIPTQAYTGSAITPALTVTYSGKTLTLGTDYTVTYYNNTALGTASALISGKGSYTGTKTVNFTIASSGSSDSGSSSATTSIANATVTVPSQTYTGSALTPAPTVTLNGKTLTQGTDYTVSYSNNTNVGTATLTITGKGSYSGSKTVSFTIAAASSGSTSTSIANATVSVASQTYTGSALTPAPTVTLNGKTLTQGTDYTVAYGNNTNVGTASVTITGKGSYSGTKTVSFTISQANVGSATVSSIANQTYTGSAISPTPTVTLNGRTLSRGTDYTLAYANNTAVGTATVTITGQGNYTGAKQVTFKIVAGSVASATVSAIANQTYTGSALTPAVTVTLNGRTLSSSNDYSLSYSNNTNVGTATVTVTGKGSYSGTKQATFKIVAASLSGASLNVNGQTYTGSALKPAVTVRVNGVTLTQGTHYTVSYSNNTNAGTATATVTGTGNYTGTAKTNFTIGKAALSSAKFSALAAQTYTGAALTPKPTLTFNGTTLKENTDYTVGYSNNTNPGTAALVCTATSSSNFNGSKTLNFTIGKADVSKATVSSIATQSYTGSAITPAVTVTLNGKTLKQGTDYAVAYSNNVNTGTASVKITGANNYTGTKTVNFTIAGTSISGASVTGISNQTYTGSAIVPAVTVTLNGKKLTKDTDYTVTCSNNTNAGTASVVITGKGGYSGTITKSFAISQRSISGGSITVSAQTYTGSALTPAPKIVVNSRTLTANTDYTTAYSNNTNAGTATVTVTAKGNYSGSLSTTFKINQASISGASVKAADQTYTGSALKPAVTVTLDGKQLGSGDYTAAYRDNTAVGTATVTVTGKGNYAGTATGTFKIAAKKGTGIARVAGDTRYDTMGRLTDRGGWSTGGTVILASGQNFPDALAASSLAGVKGAPILLTDPSSLSAETRSKLVALKPKTVCIVGGTAAVSANAESQVKAAVGGVATVRLAGGTRYETGLKVAEQVLGKSDTVIVATADGYADALSVSPYAFATGSPVVLSARGSGLDAAATALIKRGGYKKAIIVGGTAAVPSVVESQLKGAGVTGDIRRLAGASRYDTSQQIAKFELASGKGFTMDGVVLATGENFPDALAAGPLAGKGLSPLLLVDGGGDGAASFLKAYRGQVASATIIGGVNAVSASAQSKIASALGL